VLVDPSLGEREALGGLMSILEHRSSVSPRELIPEQFEDPFGGRFDEVKIDVRLPCR